MRVGGRVVSILIVALALGAALVQAVPASGHVDEDLLGLRVTWIATRTDGTQDVRVRVRIFNSSETGAYRGVCRVRVWNSRDAAVEALRVLIRPGHAIVRRFRVVLDGTSPVRAEVQRCHAA